MTENPCWKKEMFKNSDRKQSPKSRFYVMKIK